MRRPATEPPAASAAGTKRLGDQPSPPLAGAQGASVPPRKRSKPRFEINPFDVYKSIDKDNASGAADVQPNTGDPVEVERLSVLGPIEDFVDKCMKSSEPAFKLRVHLGRRDCLPVSSSSIYLKTMRQFLSAQRPAYRYSEKVKLFFTTCEKLPHWGSWSNYRPLELCPCCHRPYWVLFNELVTELRAQAKTPEFRGRLSDQSEATERMLQGMNNYADRLFLVKPQLFVVQLDVGYKPEYRDQVDMAKAKSDLTRLLNNARHNTIFAQRFGHIWKLAYSHARRRHFHLILFLLDSALQIQHYHAEAVGQYWADGIMKGNGEYSLNDSHRFKRLGTGLIRADDQKKRAELRLALEYLAKENQYLRESPAIADGNITRTRMFGTGQLPALPASP